MLDTTYMVNVVYRKGNMSTVDKDEKLAWIQLFRTTGIGPSNFWRLISRFGNAVSALEYARAKYELFPLEKAIEELAKAKKYNVESLFLNHSIFINNLAQLQDCPPVLFVKGNVELLKRPCFAIVGGRNASHHSKELARKIANELGKYGFVIVSGLAKGVDQAAHWGAMDSGTIAVMAGGVDVLYPLEHRDLYNQISQKGLLVSEMPMETQIKSEYFPRRNRLISGLSCGVLVVEASLISGSLITARYGLEQNRDIFATPGTCGDPRSKGGNYLIKQGAFLVEETQDILSALPDHILHSLKQPFSPMSKDFSKEIEDNTNELPQDLHQKILSNLSLNPMSLHEILNISQLPAQTIIRILTELEIKGSITRVSHDSFCRVVS